MKRIFTLILVMALCLMMIPNLVGCTSDNVLNVFNFGAYIDNSVLEQFKQETGITVRYSEYGTNEDMYAKIKAGGSNYDIVVPSDYMIHRMIREGLLEKLDASKIPSLANIDAKFKNPSYDPNSEYSVPYMWGTFGIMYNSKEITDPVDSWSIFWDEQYSGKLCVYDDMRNAFLMGLAKLGYSSNTTNADELKQATDELLKMPKVIFGEEDLRDKMLSGEGVVCSIYAGDAVLVAEEDPDMQYVIPKEGSNIWVDAMVMLKDAKHKDAAYKFIEFMNRTDIAEKNVLEIGYSTPNAEVFKILPEEVQNNKVAYPDQADLDRCTYFDDLGDNTNMYNDEWVRYKATAK